MQLGESVNVKVFVSTSKAHSKDTCPWHEDENFKDGTMEDEDPEIEEEAAAAIIGATDDESESDSEPSDDESEDADISHVPPNCGRILAENLRTRNSESPYRMPSKRSISLQYRRSPKRVQLGMKPGKKGKPAKPWTVARYDSAKWVKRKLQYAPHHLIPGNASLKGSKIVAYLGDQGSVSSYKPPGGSKIKKGFTGYNVNCAENGVWLPSAYALSMSGNWPSNAAIEELKSKPQHFDAALSNCDFKMRYVVRAIRASGKRQFHDSHGPYSKKVKQILDALGDRLSFVASKCPLNKEDANKSPAKFNPPMGLPRRLHSLSARFRTMTTSAWREGFYTSRLNIEFLKHDGIDKIKSATEDSIF